MIHEKIEIHLKDSEFTANLFTYFLDNSPEIDPERKRPVVLICPGGGYAMTSDGELKERMQQIRQPWSVSVPAQAAGIEALTEREEQRVQKIRNKIVEEKMRMEKKMREFGIRFIPTKANFFLLYSESSLFERLLEQGILIRNCENYRGLKKGWYRIAVRTKEENDVLLRALETILSKQ